MGTSRWGGRATALSSHSLSCGEGNGPLSQQLKGSQCFRGHPAESQVSGNANCVLQGPVCWREEDGQGCRSREGTGLYQAKAEGVASSDPALPLSSCAAALLPNFSGKRGLSAVSSHPGNPGCALVHCKHLTNVSSFGLWATELAKRI